MNFKTLLFQIYKKEWTQNDQPWSMEGILTVLDVMKLRPVLRLSDFVSKDLNLWFFSHFTTIYNSNNR